MKLVMMGIGLENGREKVKGERKYEGIGGKRKDRKGKRECEGEGKGKKGDEEERRERKG